MMKTYRAKYNPNSKNVYGVSLVENPAMEGDFIQFSKQEPIKFADVDKDKRRIMGLILEPNKLVYRYNERTNEEFNIVFTEQDIEDVAYNFQKQSNQNTSTLEHQGRNIEGVTFVETWIVENSEVDKSTNFGFSYPKGSWMGVMQIDNEEVWLNYVKTGKVKGFSIDAFMQLEEINFNTDKMSEIKEDSLVKKVTDAILTTFNISKKEEVKEVELKEVEVKEPETVELKEEVKEDIKVEFNQDTFLANFIKEINEILNPLKTELAEVKKENEELKVSFSNQAKQIEELEKQPATKSVVKAPTQVDFSKMTELEKRKWYRNNG